MRYTLPKEPRPISFSTVHCGQILQEPLREPCNHNAAHKCAFYRELLAQLPIRHIKYTLSETEKVKNIEKKRV